MYTRLVSFKHKPEHREKVARILKDFMPVMKTQAGFTDVITLTPEPNQNEIVTLSFWTSKEEALRFQEETFPKLHESLRDYLMMAPHVTIQKLETSTFHKAHRTAA